jgi:iron(III) transport system substrate-binding protein
VPSVLFALPALLLTLVACGGGDEVAADPETSGGAARGASLTVYSGRSEEYVGPVLDDFEKTRGVEIEVRYGDSAELAATIAEEGENTPADVFIAQDAGSLGAVAAEGLLRPLPAATVERVDARFRAADRTWVGTSGRARVAVYNTEALKPADLPASVLDMTDPRWKDQVGIAPNNASFQAFVTALRLDRGDETARGFLVGLKDNGARLYENNSQIAEAVAAGEIKVGLVNNYYLHQIRKEQPDAAAANHFFAAGDPGALINTAGVGVLKTSDDAASGEALAAFLLTEGAQAYFAEQVGEYPLVAGTSPPPDSPPLADVQGPPLTLADLGPELEDTLRMLSEVGLTS